jgi:S1-C subfamily serine protease
VRAVLTVCALSIAVLASSPVVARTWRLQAGGPTIEADLIDVRQGQAVLRKPDGALVSVPVEKLSEEDSRYLDEVINAAVRRIQEKAASSRARGGAEGASPAPVKSPDAAPVPLAQWQPFREGPTQPETPASALQYRWEEGRDYPYLFEATADDGRYVQTVKAVVVFRVEAGGAARPPKSLSRFVPGEEQDVGTAFVVRPDGYLVTTAGLLENAERVDVQLGGKSYTARILALNTRYDLALLQIPATDLTPLPLAAAESVRTGDEAGVVGYEHPDASKSVLRWRAGTVAGLVAWDGDRTLQMDAGFPVGFVGGPLVNCRGEVSGVARESLAAGAVTDVGLAIPVQYVRDLLARKGLQFHERADGKPQDKAALLESVGSSVGVVKVGWREHASQVASCQTLTYDTCWLAAVRSRQGYGALPEKMESFLEDACEKGRVVVDPFGRVLDMTGTRFLPLLLGRPGLLPLEALSPTGESTWKERSSVRLNAVAEHALPMRFRPADLPLLPDHAQTPAFRLGGLLLDPRVEGTVVARRAVVYELAGTRGDNVVVKKHAELHTLDPPGRPKQAEIVEDGTIQFDRVSGLPQASETTMTIRHQDESKDVKISLRTSGHVVSKERWNELARAPGGSGVPVLAQAYIWSKEIQDAVKKASRSCGNEAWIDRYLAECHVAEAGYDLETQVRCLSQLAELEPIESHRARVLAQADATAKHRIETLAVAGLKLLGAWAKEDDLARVAQFLDDPADAKRSAVIDALAKRKAPSAAKALAQHLTHPKDGDHTARVLADMASVAELPVIEMLGRKEPDARRLACQVLAAVGGPPSVKALEGVLASGIEGPVAESARSALSAIKQKTKQEAANP